MNDTAIALACEGIGKALNRALAYDPLAPQKLSKVTGRSLLIAVTAPRLSIAVLFTENQLIITPSDEYSSAASVSGTAPALIRFLLAGDIEAAEQYQVELDDEDELIPTLLNLSRDIDIDWEALLAEHTGDVAAHLLAESLRKAQQFQQDIVTRSKSGWATYKTDSATEQPNDASDGHNKPQSPLDFIGAQLKALLP
ncbi:hypothetical protein A9Q89_09700 [Gammaproteobacteria bacterium 53_120_T64]|nr:hypothetical protein A9Q89_09700 [Gammaproteobacteria bacterium 53_120_T64]